MKKGFWVQADAYFFRALGLGLGFAGCGALLINNEPGKVFTNIYGIIFFIFFGSLAVYSALAIFWDIFNMRNGR